MTVEGSLLIHTKLLAKEPKLLQSPFATKTFLPVINAVEYTTENSFALVNCKIEFEEAFTLQNFRSIRTLLYDENEVQYQAGKGKIFKVVNANLAQNIKTRKAQIELTLKVDEEDLNTFFPKATKQTLNSSILFFDVGHSVRTE